MEYYNYIHDGNTTLAVDKETGEITPTVTITAPVGTTFRTPKQREAYKRLKQKETTKQFFRRELSELGNFYFILVEDIFSDLKPETVTKLIMMCSYLNYENQFMKTERTPMKKSDIQQILKLSRSGTYQFLKEVSPQYIDEINGKLVLNRADTILRGKISNDNTYKQYQRFYINSVRKLYNSISSRQHAQLGYIFKLLPYINIEFNIICSNPFEKELRNVVPLTIGEFCDKIGYNRANFHRLINTYRQIIFNVDGRDELFVSYIWNGDRDKQNNLKIYVNPHILYAGTNYKQVEMLGEFCIIRDNNSTLSGLSKIGQNSL